MDILACPSLKMAIHLDNKSPAKRLTSIEKKCTYICTRVSNCTVFTESGQNLSFLQPSAKTTIYGRICINIFLRSRTYKKLTHTFAHHCKLRVKTCSLLYVHLLRNKVYVLYSRNNFFVKKLCQIW